MSFASETIAGALKDAKAVIDKPENWCRETYARDAEGEGAEPYDPEAVCWCSLGALHVACGPTNQVLADLCAAHLHRAAEMETDGEYFSIDDANDALEHAALMKIWDRAIEMAGG